MRLRSFSLFALATLLVASLGVALPGPAQATAPLAVDAGGSQGAWDGGVITLDGAARGGTAPYTYAWSFTDPTRFSSTAAEDPTFNASGLATGNYTLTLTVTDAASATASDSVKIRVAPSRVLLNTATTTYAGVDDEQHGESLDARSFAFNVPTRIDRIRASLAWTPGSPPADLDLSITDPFGGDPAPAQGQAGTNPETLEVADPFPGGWRLVVEPKSGIGTRFTLVARGGDITYFPDVFVPAFEFGADDPQLLTPLGRFTVGPYTYEWDLDHDGWFETVGENVTASLPVGTHLVTVRVTDANGFTDDTTTTVVVRAGDHVRSLVCGGIPDRLWAMEYTASRGTCWLHGGHHTYYFGGDTLAFRGARGFAFSVEQEYAPSGAVVNLSRDPVTTPLYVQVSLDGVSWATVGEGVYEYGLLRQTVWLDVAGAGQPFRFLRLHVPLSLSQGLSGYLDHSGLTVEVDEVAAQTLVANGTAKSLDCRQGLVMEAFFAAHPCWFGGVDRYDAPSFFHTYVVGPGSDLTRISGSFTLGPWRSDDYNRPIGGASNTASKAYVQVSANGVDWTDVALLNATYGLAQPFSVNVSLENVTFVRLFPEYHANFDQWQTLAPLHHPRAYFLDSRVSVEGTLQRWA